MAVTDKKGKTRPLTQLPSGASTSAKQDDIISELQSISGVARATDMEGGKVTVGTTAVEVTFIGTPDAVIVSADLNNSGVLYIGKSDVTSTGDNAIVFLRAGESLEMDYNDTSNAIYVVASVANQNFWKGALL